MLVEKSSVVVETKKIGPNYEASSAWEVVKILIFYILPLKYRNLHWCNQKFRYFSLSFKIFFYSYAKIFVSVFQMILSNISTPQPPQRSRIFLINCNHLDGISISAYTVILLKGQFKILKFLQEVPVSGTFNIGVM